MKRNAYLLFVALFGFLPSLLRAGIILETPVKDAEISTRSPQMQRFLSADAAETEQIFQDKKQRTELRKFRDCIPVTFAWRLTDGETGPFSICISEKSDLSSAAPLFLGKAEQQNALSVANFEPGKRYFWQVTGKDKNGRSVNSQVGTFVTANELPRQMFVPAIPNMRDIGGRTGLSGKRIRCGMIFRSAGMNDNSPDMIADSLQLRSGKLKRSDITQERIAQYRPGKSRITREGSEYLEKVIQLRTDLDLRSPKETGNATVSPAGGKVQFINVPFIYYAQIFKKHNYAPVAKAFRVFCDKNNYPVDFHCIGGADRTGTLACLLLGVLGVDAESLKRDWLMTANPTFDVKKNWDPLMNGFTTFAPAGSPLHQQIEGYLHTIGITDGEISSFRTIMLENYAVSPSAAKTLPEQFTVACVNCGKFHYGDKKTETGTYRDNWRVMMQKANADLFFFEDVGKTSPFSMKGVGALDICYLARVQIQEVAILPLPREFKGKKSPRYRALRLCCRVNDKRIVFYGVHLVAEGHIPGRERNANNFSPSQQLRQMQFADLIADAKNYDHAVLCGDFNAQKPEEYDIFIKNGFTLTNCSRRFGVKASLRKIPADNIIVSSGLEIIDFQLLDRFHLNTDHIPLKAVIRIKN